MFRTIYDKGLPGKHDIEGRVGLYKHAKMKDVAIYPVIVSWNDATNCYEILVQWFNITCRKRLDMGVREELVIPLEKINDWEYYAPLPENTEAMCGVSYV